MRRRQIQQLTIHETIKVAPKAPIPEHARFKGYRDFMAQDLRIQPHNTRYRLEVWQTPDGERRVGHTRGTSEQQKARHGGRRAGRWPVQLRYACALTGAQKVNQQAWEQASLPRCPLHPQGGCGLARHGTYRRVSPLGTRIARWYCPTGPRTFSLLPDCLAARLSGTLSEVEALLTTKEDNPKLSAQLVIREARKSPDVPQELPLPASTVRRLLARHGLMDMPKEEPGESDRRRVDVVHHPDVAVG